MESPFGNGQMADLIKKLSQEASNQKFENGVTMEEDIRLNYITREFNRKTANPINVMDMIRLVKFYASRHQEMGRYAR